jgi:predicted ATPase/class 3 adenylate cyclase
MPPLRVSWDTAGRREGVGLAELPQGTVTFLFTDLEGSTRLWEDQPTAMPDALARHDELVRDAVVAGNGHVVKTTGDGFHAVFANADDALAAATEAQVRLHSESWDLPAPLRVRMGLHTCHVEMRDGDYYGNEVNRAARLMAVAHGGQLVVSETVATLVRGQLPPDVGLVDLGEHRLRDLSRAIGVFQVTHPALPREFAPLQSLDVLPGNLPVQLTSFIGRDDERKRIADELRHAHVVTLTGVGGVGKTRLALEVAADVIPEYRAGAWFVELAGVRDPDAVPDAIMATFGLQAPTGMSVTDGLLEFLRTKELLLVLDNCEHVLRAAVGVVDAVTRGCPQVRILATSREGLNVAGERMLGVPSLAVPDGSAGLDEIAQCDAVALFVDRAQAVKANFALDDANAVAVAQICRRLDGIALAVILAAARVAMLTPNDIARRLDQRFRLLAGGQRATVERHQTLRATVDWSYELLDEREQRLLDRLSVFAGGFSLEAAEAVTAGGAVGVDDVFDLLATLVGRSLVVADTEGVDARYRLLETIRQYAQEHLDASGYGDKLRTEHAVHYADFAEEAMAGLAGPDGFDWERRLEAEFDNVRAALAWAVETGNVDVALRMFSLLGLPVMWSDVNLYSTTLEVTDAIAAIPGGADHPKFPAALAVAANIANGRGDRELGRRLCDEAVAAEQRLGVEPSALVYMARFNIAMSQGSLDEMVDQGVRLAELARAGGDSVSLAYGLAATALARALGGDAVGAAADAEQALAVTRLLANPYIVQTPMAAAAFGLGNSEPERALLIAREVLALDPRRRNVFPIAIVGELAERNGEHAEALEHMIAALKMMQWQSLRWGAGTVLIRIATILADRDPEAAAVLDGAGEALAPGFVHHADTAASRQQAAAISTASLGAARYAELYERGLAMTGDEAMTYAIGAVNRYLSEE